MTCKPLIRLVAAGAAVASIALASPAGAAERLKLSGFWEPPHDAMKPLAKPKLTPYAEGFRTETKRSALALNGIDESDIYCLPPGQPWILTQSAPIDILQSDRETTMMYEQHGAPWHIYTDGRKHPDLKTYVPTTHGHSIGWWEGEVFVVDTVGFAEREGNTFPFELPPSFKRTPTLHVTQRFHLEADGQRLVAEFSIDDPVQLLEPYRYEFRWNRSPPGTYALMDDCDPRNPAQRRY